MKPILKKILMPTASAVVGGLIVFGSLKLSPSLRARMNSEHSTQQSRATIFNDILNKQNVIQDQFENMFDYDFFNQGDPFNEMKKLREQMEKQIDSLAKPTRRFSSNPFDSWFSDRFGGTVNDISKREDDDFVYYDIKVEDVNATSIQTKIESGYIMIMGTTEKKSKTSDEKNKDGFSAESICKSTFNRTFPLPERVDASKMEMTSEKDKIVLRFPKIKT